MTYEDTRKVLSVIKASFPQHFAKWTAEEGKNFLAVWSDMFVDDDPMLVMTAVKSYIRSNTSPFPPSVGQIVDLMQKLTSPTSMTEQEAWGYVEKALRNSIYNSQKEFEALPSDVQRTVGSPNQLKQWAQMEMGEINSVVASNFMRSYRSRVAENKEFAKLPTQAQNLITGLTNQMRLDNNIKQEE